jgi:hypothetical protein
VTFPVPTGQPGPSEQDYLNAANGWFTEVEQALGKTSSPYFSGERERISATAWFRAAVDSAFAAGWRARDAQVRKPLPMCDNGEVVMVTDMAAYLRGRSVPDA